MASVSLRGFQRRTPQSVRLRLDDARFRLTDNVIGAPALPTGEFAKYRHGVVVGASLGSSMPVGDYDPDRLVNVDTNRWGVKFEIGASKARRR